MMRRDEIIKIIETHPLVISQTRRAGTNGLKNAGEIADKILSLIGKEESND